MSVKLNCHGNVNVGIKVTKALKCLQINLSLVVIA